MTSILIPESVISIGWSAFASNQLTSVTLPASVITIEGYAFSNNQLTSIVIPAGVKSIDAGVFANNPLEDVTIGANVNVVDTTSYDIGNVRNWIDFLIYYETTGKKAGMYIYKNNKWGKK